VTPPATAEAPAPSAAAPPRRAAVVLGALLLAYLALGAAVAWTAPLEWDEAHYYRPVHETFADLPLALRTDYRLPMPPLALHAYSTLYRLSGRSVPATRLLSTVATALLGLVLLRHPARGRGVALALVLSFPIVVTSAFSMKVNAVALLLAVTGVVAYLRDEASPSRSSRVAAAAALAGAALSHQMVLAPLLGLAAFSALDRSAPRGLRAERAAVFLVPALALGALFLHWGGFQPPAFRLAGSEPEVGAATLGGGQLVCGLTVVGAWLPAAVGLPRRAAVAALVLWGPACAFVHHTQVLAGNVMTGPRYLFGPVRTAVDRLSLRTYEGQVAIVGLLVALGACAAVSIARSGRDGRRWAFVAAAYAAMMNGVPYVYEQYYLVLVGVGHVLLAPSIEGAPRTTALRVLRAAAVAYGFAFAVYTYL
jgi:hypothetical protein